MQASTSQFADPSSGTPNPGSRDAPAPLPFRGTSGVSPEAAFRFFFSPRLRRAVVGATGGTARDRGQEARTRMDEGRPPGKACIAGKAALGPSRPHPALDRGGRPGPAQFCLPSCMTMTADEAKRRGRRRDLARNGLLSREWRRGEGVIYRTKLGRRLVPPRGDAAPGLACRGEGQSQGWAFPAERLGPGVEQPFLAVIAAPRIKGTKPQNRREGAARSGRGKWVSPRNC